MVALWLFLRFELSVATTGAVFFWSGLAHRRSMPLSARLARRIGLVNTMVFTHLPAQLSADRRCVHADRRRWPSASCWPALRSAAMDVPARTSYVMAVVPPDERAAAAGVTNVPRSLVAAAGPALAGWMLARSTFGWPLLIAGVFKIDLRRCCCWPRSAMSARRRRADASPEQPSQGSMSTPGLRMPSGSSVPLGRPQGVGEQLGPLAVVALGPVHAADRVVVGDGAAGVDDGLVGGRLHLLPHGDLRALAGPCPTRCSRAPGPSV